MKTIKLEDMSECPECLQPASKQELKGYGGICKDCWYEIHESQKKPENGKDND